MKSFGTTSMMFIAFFCACAESHAQNIEWRTRSVNALSLAMQMHDHLITLMAKHTLQGSDSAASPDQSIFAARLSKRSNSKSVRRVFARRCMNERCSVTSGNFE
jgi:hypothetical protein